MSFLNETIFEKLLSVDPTQDKRYSTWLCKCYFDMNESSKEELIEDFLIIKDALLKFHSNRKLIKENFIEDASNIMSFENLDEFISFVDTELK